MHRVIINVLIVPPASQPFGGASHLASRKQALGSGSAHPQHMPLPAGDGVDSDGTLYPSAAKPAAAAPEGALISLTAAAPARPLTDAGSVPDIDSVSAPGAAQHAPATAQIGVPAAVPEVSISSLQRAARQASPTHRQRGVAGQSSALVAVRSVNQVQCPVRMIQGASAQQAGLVNAG